MKILFTSLKYNYGIRKLGYSPEYYHAYLSLKDMGHQILFFDYIDFYQKFGKKKMNDILWKTFQEYKPDFFFCILFEEQFEKEVISQISKTKTVTMTWFADDKWRFDIYSQFWAKCFNWVTTTEEDYVEKYERKGFKNILYFPYAINPKVFRPYKIAKTLNVTFVGGPHGFRRESRKELKKANIPVKFFGKHWNRQLSLNEMVKLFSKSKINLNFTETSYQGNQILFYLRKYNLVPRIRQHKARIFEIPGSGGFELSGWTKGIEKLYEPGKEIAIFKSTDELIEKCRFYLKDSKKREAIAQAGYKRTLADHTYEKRFSNLFKQIGLRKNRVSLAVGVN